MDGPGSGSLGGGFLSPPGQARQNVSRTGWRWVRMPPSRFGQAWMCTGLLVSFAISAILFVSVSVELPYRAGWSGTEGTLSQVSCDTSDALNSCSGQFTPAGANGKQVFATVEGTNLLDPNTSYQVRLHSDGETASVVAAKTVAYILAAMSLLLMALVLTGGYLALGVLALARSRPGLVWGPSRFQALLPLVLAGALGLLALVGEVLGSRLVV